MVILQAYLKENPPVDSTSDWVPIYRHYLLPMVSIHHFSLIQDTIPEIIQLFLNKCPKETASITWRSIFQSFPITNPSKTEIFLNLLTYALAKAPQREVWANMRIIFPFFARFSGWCQLKVCEAAFSVWNRIELEPLIIDNANVIFPLVYPILMQALKESWNPKLANEIELVLNTLDRIDSLVFQDLCRRKNAKVMTQDVEAQKNWSVIARYASQNDAGVDLARQLMSIQKYYGRVQYVAMEKVTRPPKAPEAQPIVVGQPLGKATVRCLSKSGGAIATKPLIKRPF
jgi:hypothetical protein